MVPNALLQKPVKVVPKARMLRFHDPPNQDAAPVLRLSTLPVCKSIRNDTPGVWSYVTVKDPANASDPGLPMVISLVYGCHAVLWWVGLDPRTSAYFSEVWVDVEGVPTDRCNPTHDVKMAPHIPDIQPVMALKDEDFNGELYLRLQQHNLQKRADALLPGNLRFCEFYNEYKRRAYFVRICRRVPDNKDRRFCMVELFVNIKPAPQCSPLMAIDSGEEMGTPFQNPIRVCNNKSNLRAVDQQHIIPSRTRPGYQHMEF